MNPKGQYNRGYLPHRDYGSALQGITFREADCLPTHVIERWQDELKERLASPEEAVQVIANQELTRRIAQYEDAGRGQCFLRQPPLAQIVQETLQEGHHHHYRLIAWRVMPNHVHILIKQNTDASLAKIVKSWKGRSARKINLALNRSGTLWARDYFDRVIRDDDHFWNALTYIHHNPVRAGLVKEPADWAFSSLGCGWPLPRQED